VSGTERFVEDYRRLVAPRASVVPAWLGPLRDAAISRFAATGFPTPREEDWKYTNVARLVSLGFRPALDGRGGAGAVAASLLGAAAASRLAFVNGRFVADASTGADLPPGVRLQSLAAAFEAGSTVVERHLTRHAGFDRNGFTALSTAFLADGAVLEVEDGVVLDRPVEVVFASDGREGERIGYPRLLVVFGREAEASLVESYVSIDGAPTLTNAVTEVVLGEGSRLAHLRLVRDGADGSHVATTAVVQGRDSRYASGALALRALFLRHELDVRLGGEGAECSLDGVYLAAGKEFVDNHTSIEHVVPHGTSRELYKGVLAGHARAVFNGKVIVRPNAQKSNAQQTNKNLLLSAHTEIDSKPELQILADDVKCAHGAAIGEPDPDAVFYLKSRGIGDAAGRMLLTRGFVGEVVQRIASEELRAAAETAVFERLEQIFAEEP
jgi:Fe-S cluster assembly protein SufD